MSHRSKQKATSPTQEPYFNTITPSNYQLLRTKEHHASMPKNHLHLQTNPTLAAAGTGISTNTFRAWHRQTTKKLTHITLVITCGGDNRMMLWLIPRDAGGGGGGEGRGESGGGDYIYSLISKGRRAGKGEAMRRRRATLVDGVYGPAAQECRVRMSAW